MATKPLARRKPTEETIFVWEGTDRRGTKVKGELRGTNPNLVRAEIRRQGITPHKVKKKPKALFTFGDNITPQDIMLFTRQLCTMLDSGIAIVQALEMVGHGSKKPKLKNLILDIKTNVEGGTRFADALANHHYYFDDLYVSLVRAGEEAGVLENILNKIAIYLEKIEGIKAKIKKALLYPAIVMVVAFGGNRFYHDFCYSYLRGFIQKFWCRSPSVHSHGN